MCLVCLVYLVEPDSPKSSPDYSRIPSRGVQNRSQPGLFANEADTQRTCEMAAEGLREERNALGAAFFLLLRLLVGLHFYLLHGVLEAGPFFRNHRLKLKAELPPSAPPN